MSWDDTASTVVELQSALHLLKSLQACLALCTASLPLPCAASLLCCSSSFRLGHNTSLGHVDVRLSAPMSSFALGPPSAQGS
jgi:hypothetical protein